MRPDQPRFATLTQHFAVSPGWQIDDKMRAQRKQRIMRWAIAVIGAVLVLHTVGTMLDVTRRSSASHGPTIPYKIQTAPLDTPWTNGLNTDPWPEYPRPQLQRSEWRSLNGLWHYRNATGPYETPPWGQNLSYEVMVPSCLESALSGLSGQYTIHSWMSRTFLVPDSWKSQRTLLNFGAVDYEVTVHINGKVVGTHRGGFSAFTIDVTDQIQYGNAANELLLFIYDPTDAQDVVIPVGKQTLDPNHYFYTPCSGIWQSVWLEAAAMNNYITQFDLSGDMNGDIAVQVHTFNKGQDKAIITVTERGEPDNKIASKTVNTDKLETFSTTKTPKMWDPDAPQLYDVKIQVGDDKVSSYIGFRTVESRKVDGVLRVMLNGKWLFPFGTLDQGYWPDGIYTPPNRAAMIYDLQMLKTIGMNMVRKHIKVEPSLFYTACDEIGLLVIQDMPSPRPMQQRKLPDCSTPPYLPSNAEQEDFVVQLRDMVEQLKSHPSIFAWTIYNEGWGQLLTQNNGRFVEHDLVDAVRAIDPTRLISATSGWTDHGAGDFSDTHTYASPKCGTPFYKIPSSPYDRSRIALQGEFGGIGHNLSEANLWTHPAAMVTINQTYELNDDLPTYNYRARQLLRELREQIELYDCSGAVWTQTTDVEGEVNGLLSYDRRVFRADLEMWQEEIQGLYDAAEKRGARAYKVVKGKELPPPGKGSP